MRVFTPVEVTQHVANKYLAVLVAAKYTRILNERRLPGMSAVHEKKLTTQALEQLAGGEIPHRVLTRKRP
jgi:DNA-directed RNA polymerase subunit K/omega